MPNISSLWARRNLDSVKRRNGPGARSGYYPDTRANFDLFCFQIEAGLHKPYIQLRYALRKTGLEAKRAI